MTDTTYNTNTCIEDYETEDGEIDERSSSDIKLKTDEIENYYLNLNQLGKDLRCSCCNDVYSDPIKLKCQHLIDRSCAVIAKKDNVVQCAICRQLTVCDDVEQLLTDFDIASRIPPKPESLIEIINRHGGALIESNQLRKRALLNSSDETETMAPRKRKRKSRWNSAEDSAHSSFSGAIMDILSSENVPKNITMSQYKKFTEISSQSSLMSLLTKTVLQSVNNQAKKRHSKKSDRFSDADILEMIVANDAEELFELEKIQFIKLYRDALDKGVLVLSSHNYLSKEPLLPNPKSHYNNPLKSSNDYSPESPQKLIPPESNKTSIVHSIVPESTIEIIAKEANIKSTTEPIVDCKNEIKVALVHGNSCQTPLSPNCDSKMDKDNDREEKEDNLADDSRHYEESVARLHSIYSIMYHASLTMKELENEIQSTDYQIAHKTYSDNYADYQKLYSILQSGVVDKIESVPNDSNEQSMVMVNCQEQASSTISPGGYAPDSTDSSSNKPKKKRATKNQLHIDTSVRSAVSDSMSPLDVQRSRIETQEDNKDKFGYLWVSNLCQETRTNDLCNLFGKVGHVSKIKLFQYRAQTPMTFFSLIFMSSIAEAETAYKALQHTVLHDCVLHIKMLEHNPLCNDRVV